MKECFDNFRVGDTVAVDIVSRSGIFQWKARTEHEQAAATIRYVVTEKREQADPNIQLLPEYSERFPSIRTVETLRLRWILYYVVCIEKKEDN